MWTPIEFAVLFALVVYMVYYHAYSRGVINLFRALYKIDAIRLERLDQYYLNKKGGDSKWL